MIINHFNKFYRVFSKKVTHNVILFTLCLSVAGCKVGPDYQKPELRMPDSVSFKKDRLASSEAMSHAYDVIPENWWNLFNSQEIDILVEELLSNNHDLLITAARLEQVHATLKDTNADFFPKLQLEADKRRNRFSRNDSISNFRRQSIFTNNRLAVSFSWELDFWGRLRRLSEVARANIIATEYGAIALRQTLVKDFLHGYFDLLAIDRSIDVTESLVKTGSENLRLQKNRYEQGVISEYLYRQAEVQQMLIEARLPVLKQSREELESALLVLLGRSATEITSVPIPRQASDVRAQIDIPEGVPSQLLLRRPDIVAAEARLIASNAEVGVARALYFPSIRLTGFYGQESNSLSSLFSGPSQIWNIAGGVMAPLFSAGEIAATVHRAEKEKEITLELYKQHVANSFREIRIVLRAREHATTLLTLNQKRLMSADRAYSLGKTQYRFGATSLFELLSIESQKLESELALIDAETYYQRATIDVFTALGL